MGRGNNTTPQASAGMTRAHDRMLREAAYSTTADMARSVDDGDMRRIRQARKEAENEMRKEALLGGASKAQLDRVTVYQAEVLVGLSSLEQNDSAQASGQRSFDHAAVQEGKVIAGYQTPEKVLMLLDSLEREGYVTRDSNRNLGAQGILWQLTDTGRMLI
jgi:hypothetical protein